MKGIRLLILTIASVMAFLKTKKEQDEPVRLAKPRKKKSKRKIKFPKIKFKLPITKMELLVILVAILLFIIVVSIVFYYGALESTHVYNNNSVI